eukprot:2409239-Amphidinium_carterae.1
MVGNIFVVLRVFDRVKLFLTKVHAALLELSDKGWGYYIAVGCCGEFCWFPCDLETQVPRKGPMEVQVFDWKPLQLLPDCCFSSVGHANLGLAGTGPG